MNNYLAKPVRADMLKQMLESYLNQPTKKIPNLQEEANNLVNTVVSQADEEEEEMEGSRPAQQRSPDRPKNTRRDVTEVHLNPEQRLKQSLPTRPQADRNGSGSGG